MTDNFYETKKYNNHTHFGGLISPSDFDRETTMSDVIGHIISDMKFDNQCRKNILARRRSNGRK